MIHKYRVKNFKSLIDVTIDFDPVTVLVGRSGTGKSNILDSLRALKSILLAGSLDKFARNNQNLAWNNIKHVSNGKHPLSFEVSFSIGGVDDKYFYALRFFDERNVTRGPSELYDKFPQFVDEQLLLGDKTLFHHIKREWIVKPNVAAPAAPSGVMLGSLPSLSDVVIAFTALTQGIGCYDFSDIVLTGGQYMPGSSGFVDSGSNYLNALKDIVTNLHDLHIRKNIIATIQRVNPSIMSVELNDLTKPTRVIVGHQFQDQKQIVALDLSQESAGVRRSFAHLLALYQRPPKQTMFFEHPEDGMHPGAMSILAEEFKDTPGAGRGQVVLTTHNPILLDQFSVDQMRVVELINSATRVGRISSEQRESIADALLDVGELLTTDPARLDPTSL